MLAHGSQIAFGDLPTWLLAAAAVWAGAIALRQLRDQQAQIDRLRERQINADYLLGLQLAKALEETAGSVRIEVRELKLFKFMKPGAVALFAPAPQLYTQGREVRWTARFTDISGQSWQIDTDGSPRRVTGTGTDDTQ